MRVQRGAARGVGALLAIAAVLGGTAGSARAWEQKRGTVSFGLQGGVTSLEGSGTFTREGFETEDFVYRIRDFRWGPALGIRLRYSLDRAHAVGVSFEDLRYRRKSGVSTETAKEFQVNTVLLDYYVYLARRERATPHVVLGAGFHRDSFRYGNSDSVTPPLGWAANLGAGLEYFLRPSASVDATLRGYYLGGRGAGEWEFDGSGTLAASLQLGLHYYVQP